MTSTRELARSWALLSRRERAVLVLRALAASMGNGIGAAGSAYYGARLMAGNVALTFAELWAVFLFGCVFGLFLFLARPGLKAWRRE